MQIVKHSVFLLKARVIISGSLFISGYYSPLTKRTAFALINDEKRVFGADDNDGWHLHPLKQEEKHVSCKAYAFTQFALECEKITRQL